MSNQEYQFSELIQRLDRHRANRHVLHIQLSRLKPYNRRPHQIRIAANLFDRSLRSSEGQIFIMGDGDLLFVYRTSDEQDVILGLTNLRKLFEGDPFIRRESSEAANDSQYGALAKHYRLDEHYGEVLILANRMYQIAAAAVKPKPKLVSLVGKPAQSAEKLPITPQRLGELVETITSADLSNFMRRQSIFLVTPGRPIQLIIRELFISIMDLRDLLLPNYDVLSNRWLFQYLTETLDRRMLSMLERNDDPAISASFSLNLNVASVLSPEFQSFDSKLKQSARGTIVIELQMIDIYADLPTFLFTRNYLHSSGYRICMDGITIHTLPYVEREKLNIDLVKLQWTPELGEEIGADPEGMRRKINAIGNARVILCHVDDEDAIKLGQSIGIAMFQGRHLDRLSSPVPLKAAVGQR